MFSSSPQLTQFLQSRKKHLNQTKSIIKAASCNAPILSTIIDYGGQQRVNDLLHIQPQDAQPRYHNNFQKILIQSQTHDSAQQMRNKKNTMSFIHYKTQSLKSRLPQKHSRTSTKKTLKTSLIVQMPQQLKSLKNKILNLPSINQSQLLLQKPHHHLSITGSRLLKQIKKFNQKRLSTQIENTNSPSNKFNNSKSYYKLLQDILAKFDSPSIKCNNYILNRHSQCKKIIQHQQDLVKQYQAFQNLGSPPQKILQLKNLLKTFQQAIQGSMDSQLVYQISHMDNKKYDTILKHQQQTRKVNMIKFQQRKKRQKIQQFKNNISETQLNNNHSFKINNRGRQTYHDRHKITT